MEEEQSVWASEEQRRICKELAEHYRAIISLLGDDPDREGLRKTPERTAKAMMQLTRGYRQSAQEIISSAVFEHTGSRIVVVRDIDFSSIVSSIFKRSSLLALYLPTSSKAPIKFLII